MDTNEHCVNCEKEKCCTTIVKNYYGCGCCEQETGDIEGTGMGGKSAYEIAVEYGFAGTEEEWLMSLKGKSAYEIAVDRGFIGTEAEWLTSLKAESNLDIEAFGVEHRTNILRNGKPVYKMLIDCGKVPQGATAGVNVIREIPYNISNVQKMWIVHSLISNGNVTVQVPLTSNVSVSPNYVQRIIAPQVELNKGVISVHNTCGSILNDYSMEVLVHYTKTTD